MCCRSDGQPVSLTQDLTRLASRSPDSPPRTGRQTDGSGARLAAALAAAATSCPHVASARRERQPHARAGRGAPPRGACAAQSDPTRHDSAEAIRNSKASVPGEIGDSEIGDPH